MNCCGCSVAKSCLTLCDPMDCSLPGFPVLHYLLELAQTHVHWVGDPTIHPTISSSVAPISSCPQSFPASGFSNELALRIGWPKYSSFSFNISLSSEYSGLTSFRIDWLDLLAVQGTLKSLLQAPQFKSINSFAFSHLYGPSLTSIHDYWKNHSFNYMDLC